MIVDSRMWIGLGWISYIVMWLYSWVVDQLSVSHLCDFFSVLVLSGNSRERKEKKRKGQKVDFIWAKARTFYTLQPGAKAPGY